MLLNCLAAMYLSILHFDVNHYGNSWWISNESLLLNCVGEDSWESLGLKEDPTSPS